MREGTEQTEKIRERGTGTGSQIATETGEKPDGRDGRKTYRDRYRDIQTGSGTDR